MACSRPAYFDLACRFSDSTWTRRGRWETQCTFTRCLHATKLTGECPGCPELKATPPLACIPTDLITPQLVPNSEEGISGRCVQVHWLYRCCNRREKTKLDVDDPTSTLSLLASYRHLNAKVVRNQGPHAFSDAIQTCQMRTCRTTPLSPHMSSTYQTTPDQKTFFFPFHDQPRCPEPRQQCIVQFECVLQPCRVHMGSEVSVW